MSRVRADTFGYLQRCFPTVVSSVDAREAREVGALAVRVAASGEITSGSVAIRRLENHQKYESELFITPLDTVAKHTRRLPRDYLNEAGNHVSKKFIEYALPLVSELPETGRLKMHRIDKKMEGF